MLSDPCFLKTNTRNCVLPPHPSIICTCFFKVIQLDHFSSEHKILKYLWFFLLFCCYASLYRTCSLYIIKEKKNIYWTPPLSFALCSCSWSRAIQSQWWRSTLPASTSCPSLTSCWMTLGTPTRGLASRSAPSVSSARHAPTPRWRTGSEGTY